MDGDEGEDAVAILLNDFLQDVWSGTATELCRELKKYDGSQDITPAVLTKKLKSLYGLFKEEFNIEVSFERSRNSRRIFLRRVT